MFIKRIYVIFIIFLIFSCADPSIFENNSSDITVYTVKSGALQEYGTPLKVTVDYGSESPDFDILELTLFSDTGTVLMKESFSSVSIESKTAVNVNLPSDIPKGLYHIKIKILNSGVLLKEESRSFFYASDEYRIEGVKSYPPDPVPGEKIILKADYNSPSDSDPWFRWSVDNETVSSGYASENGNTAVLGKLQVNGVLSASVEMFPYKPEDSGFQDFISFYRSDTAVFVSDKNRARSNEFSDNRNYSMLFHFRGEIADEGYTASDYPDKAEIAVSGSPELDFNSSFYGYYFSSDDSLTVKYDTNNFSRRKSTAPFTFRIKMLPDVEKMIFDDAPDIYYPLFTAGNNIDNSIVIGINESSGFYIDIKSGTDSFAGDCGYAVNKEVIDLAVNFYNRLNFTDIVWIVNGETVKKESVPFPVLLSGNSGLSYIIGGADVLIDEAGIYDIDDDGNGSVDYSLFRNIMKDRYNGDFKAADGFDYSNPEKNNKSDRFFYESGNLVIGSQSSALVFEQLELYDPVEIKTEGSAELIIKNSSGETVLAKAVSENSSVRFNPLIKSGSGKFDIYLSNSTKNEIYKVDSILITVNYSEETGLE